MAELYDASDEMTTQKPELMPDEIWIDDDKTDECVYTQQWREECVSYTRTDLYTAVVSERDKYKSAFEMAVKEKTDAMIGREDYKRERDALRELCEGMAVAAKQFKGYYVAEKAFLGDPVEIGNQLRRDVSSRDFKKLEDALTAYEKHKAGE